MDPTYAAVYRDLYERHWWWRVREELLVDVIDNLAGGRTDLHILDVGCGSGLFFDRLQQFGTVIGVEPDRSLAEAEPRHRDQIHVGELATLAIERPFDLILFLDVLEHLPDPASSLSRAFEMLARNGHIVATVPAFRALWTYHDVLNHHMTRYTRRELAELVRSAGGRTCESRYFFHWTAPAKLMARLLERIRGPRGPERIPPAGLNRALYLLSRAERRLLGPARLPFGTSLLAVAAHAPHPAREPAT